MWQSYFLNQNENASFDSGVVFLREAAVWMT